MKDIEKFNLNELKDKGHIIYISAINGKHHNAILVKELELTRIKDLIKKIMKVHTQKDIEELGEILHSKGCPTALIVDSAYYLSNNPHVSIDEYIQLITADNKMIKNYLDIIFKSVSNEAQTLLKKIAFLNNQSVSKNLLAHLVKDQGEVNALIKELLDTNLLRMINTHRDRPFFSMHDIYKEELLNNIFNKQRTLDEIVDVMNASFPIDFKYGNAIHNAFTDDETLSGNIEILLKNLDKNNNQKTPAFKVLELRLNALIEAYEQCLMSEANSYLNWFKNNFLEQAILPQSINEKKIFCSYLIHLASSEYFIHMNSSQALHHLFLAKNMIKDEGGEYNLKSYINADISQIQAYIGDLNEAEISLSENDQIPTYDLNTKIKMLFVKSLILLMRGDYESALIKINEEIQLCNQLGYSEPWPAIIGQKAKILNSLNNFQEAFDITNDLYANHFNLLIDNINDHADILTQLSRAELGLGKVKEALEHAEKAINLIINEKMDLETSENIFLAEAFLTYGNASFKLNGYEKALDSYNKAEKIFKNSYKHNHYKVDNVSYLLLQAAKASYKLDNLILYSHYVNALIKVLGSDHARMKELEAFKKTNKTSETNN